MRMNVRCCCQPHKILGTVDVPYEFSDRFVVWEDLEPINFSPNGPTMSPNVTRHEIKVRDFLAGNGKAERAVYSDDRPIEFWRKIRGFIEEPA